MNRTSKLCLWLGLELWLCLGLWLWLIPSDDDEMPEKSKKEAGTK